MESDHEPLIQPPIKLYRRRWYILGLFSAVAVLQDTIWNSWGPIDHTAILVYGWTHETVALLANYGSILYILGFIPMVWLLGHSLRLAMLVTTGFMAGGTVIRCIAMYLPDPNYTTFTVTCHICSILNGLANIVVGSAPLAISSFWFSPSERVTATTIAQVANGLGTGMSFLLASQVVRPVDHLTVNGTISPADKELLLSDIETYMFTNSIPASVLFILVLLYFPSLPPSPPSHSSHQDRLDFSSAFRHVLTNWSCWLISVGCSIPQGITVAWTAMMVVNLTQICVSPDHCLTQHWVNYLGIYTPLANTIAAILLARVADYFKGMLKEAVIGLLTIATVIFLLLSLISVGVFQPSSLLSLQVLVSLLLITGTSLTVSSMPLAMEMTMELSYPASEGIVGGFTSIWFNISTVIFLSLFSVPGIGTSWLNYVLPLASILAVPFILPVRARYRRMELDSEQSPTTCSSQYGSTSDQLSA